MRSPRRLTAAAVLLATAFAGTLSTFSTADAAPDRGDRAVARAADRYGVSESALRERLAKDPSLRLTDSGAAYFVDPLPVGDPEPAEVAPQAFPLEDTFELHSKPDSLLTIYLDFDGHDVSGTLWNDSCCGNVPDGTHPAMDLAGNGPSFTNDELLQIQDIYQRVAEDYAPFDVDVTTQDPGNPAITRSNSSDLEYGTRALITPSASAAGGICNNQCGGVAFTGVFNHYSGKDNFVETHGQLQPAWVFPQLLGDDVKSIAEAATHEVGHNLGLDHDATSTEGYYTGHNGWAPIMGVAYNEPIGQFALSDYPDAVLGGPTPPPTPLQPNEDDIETITGFGPQLRTDEPGNSIGSAGAVPTGAAYIRHEDDIDYYALGNCSGNVTVNANNAEVSPNLDIELRLLNTSNVVVTSADPASARVDRDIASGMDASVSTSVASGAYYVRVDGVGRGTSLNGYTDYGSVGAYTLDVTGCDGTVPEPPDESKPGKPRIGEATPGARGGKLTAKVRWLPPAGTTNPAINGYQVIAYKRNSNGKYVKVSTSPVYPASKRSTTYTAGSRAKLKFAVKARNSLGFGPLSAQSNAVTPR